MRKSVSLIACTLTAMLLSSCVTLTKTAKTADVAASLQNATVADLTVGERITYTTHPSKAIQKGGMGNVKQAVEAEALATKASNADILLDPQFVVTRKRSLFGSRITEVTVSGRPATYTNFRSLPDSIWAKPGFSDSYYARANRRSFLHNPAAFASASAASRGYAPARPKRDWRSPGLRFAVEANVALGVNHLGDNGSVGLNLLAGSQITPNIYVGLGVGFNYIDIQGNEYFDRVGYRERWLDKFDETQIPLFGQVRLFSNSHSKVTPFLDFKVGYEVDIDGYYDGRFFFRPAIGLRMGRFDISLSYEHVKFEEDHGDEWYREAKDDFLGFSFQYNF